MLTQTGALFLDAYRELNAKKMFWITLVISVLVVAIFAIVGINSKGVTILWFEFPRILGFSINTGLIPKAMFFKWLFSGLGVGWWLNWLGIILALVSTAGIIPDFVSGGSVDLYLSKPIGRLRLFLTKYLTGLLFVALQVTFFTLNCFVLIGIRAGSWDWKMFLAIPVALLVFSYLYSVCSLLGLITHSTVASLLLTILFWFLIFGIDTAANGFLAGKIASRIETEAYARQFAFSDSDIAQLVARRSSAKEEELKGIDASLKAAQAHRRDLEDKKRATDPSRQDIATTYSLLAAVQWVLPKTGQTSALLERWLALQTEDVWDEHIEQRDRRRAARAGGFFSGFKDRTDVHADDAEVLRELSEINFKRPALKIIGSSLLFEGMILGICCWIFARRDF